MVIILNIFKLIQWILQFPVRLSDYT